ncbi:hypothetical protein L596_017504 [Steinernema carpocapsae]|uniref:C2H2-type domain-containing protein n=1 Tax=Steinernema carpocapsae TaxID=34508 RepID=A0A4U5N1W4_STECR|nr:hypothetical protein L596_017504 [Steinernema carpocapsae]
MKCLICGEHHTRSLLYDAINEHLDYKKYQCAQCNFGSSSLTALHEHRTQVDHEVSSESFVDHFYLEHIAKIVRGDFEYAEKHGFRTLEQCTPVRENRLDVQGAQAKCMLCDDGLIGRGAVKEHISEHLGYRPHKCADCNFATSRAIELEQHSQDLNHQVEYRANAHLYFERLVNMISQDMFYAVTNGTCEDPKALFKGIVNRPLDTGVDNIKKTEIVESDRSKKRKTIQVVDIKEESPEPVPQKLFVLDKIPEKPPVVRERSPMLRRPLLPDPSGPRTPPPGPYPKARLPAPRQRSPARPTLLRDLPRQRSRAPILTHLRSPAPPVTLNYPPGRRPSPASSINCPRSPAPVLTRPRSPPPTQKRARSPALHPAMFRSPVPSSSRARTPPLMGNRDRSPAPRARSPLITREPLAKVSKSSYPQGTQRWSEILTENERQKPQDRPRSPAPSRSSYDNGRLKLQDRSPGPIIVYDSARQTPQDRQRSPASSKSVYENNRTPQQQRGPRGLQNGTPTNCFQTAIFQTKVKSRSPAPSKPVSDDDRVPRQLFLARGPRHVQNEFSVDYKKRVACKRCHPSYAKMSADYLLRRKHVNEHHMIATPFDDPDYYDLLESQIKLCFKDYKELAYADDQCTKCLERFNSVDKMKKHVETAHSVLKILACPVQGCTRERTNPLDLKQHIDKDHKGIRKAEETQFTKMSRDYYESKRKEHDDCFPGAMYCHQRWKTVKPVYHSMQQGKANRLQNAIGLMKSAVSAVGEEASGSKKAKMDTSDDEDFHEEFKKTPSSSDEE